MQDAATDVMIECLDLVEAGARPLVVDDETGQLVVALAACGAAPNAWNRRVIAGRTSTAMPWLQACDAPGATSALLRMPKAKEALPMSLHAAASLLPVGAPIVVFGANDEGIRSASSRLDEVADDLATLAAKRHCRVIAGRRRDALSGLRSQLTDWRRVVDITIGGATRPWVSYPGCFAKGGLDAGTRLLIDNLQRLPPRSRVLDFATGTGVIAAAVRAHTPDAALDLLDIDTVALEAARENVPGARVIASWSLEAVAGANYDAILSNPPIHAGIAEDHKVLAALIAGAPTQLKRGGSLTIVVQRRVRVDRMIEDAFGSLTRLAETGEFRVLRGTKV